MLCHIASTKRGPAGLEEAREAGTLIDKVKEYVDLSDGVVVEGKNKEQAASVLLAEGIWNSVMADKGNIMNFPGRWRNFYCQLTEQDPRTRSTRFSHSLALFNRSVKTFATPSAYYHLALALVRPGAEQNLEEAIIWARKSVEEEPGEMRFWHLLGLLLTATEEWVAAKRVLEEGASLAEGEDAFEEDKVPEKVQEVAKKPNENGDRDGEVHGHMKKNSVGGKESMKSGVDGLTNGRTDNPATQSNHDLATLSIPPHALLDLHDKNLPSAASLLPPLPDHPRPSRLEVFEQALQLRMTQVVLTEYVEGAEGAGDKWVDVFSWIAERKEIGPERREPSPTITPKMPLNSSLRSSDGRWSTFFGAQVPLRNWPSPTLGKDHPPPFSPRSLSWTQTLSRVYSKPPNSTITKDYQQSQTILTSTFNVRQGSREAQPQAVIFYGTRHHEKQKSTTNAETPGAPVTSQNKYYIEENWERRG
jgi:hypothetical protein